MNADSADLRGFGFACGKVFCHEGTKTQSGLNRKMVSSYLSAFVANLIPNRAEGVIKIRVNPPSPPSPRCYSCRFGMEIEEQ